MFYTFQATKALSGEARFKIVAELLKGKMSVQQIADAIGESHSHTSHQLGILRAAEVVTCTKDAQSVIYEIGTSKTAKEVRRIMRG